MNKIRCLWVPQNDPLYLEYHDKEWGVPVHDDRKLFEMLILEGAQAGLSWITVLRKREGYKKFFFDFDVEKCSEMSDERLNEVLASPEIIRNRLKVFSVRKNAIAFIKIQEEFGSFSKYLWSYVDEKPLCNHFETISQVPVKSDLSDRISKDLKKRGMSFVGSTIIYSYLQAVGVLNDHTTNCFRCNELITDL